METAYQEQAKVFKALCDPKRLAILEQLRSGEKCACILQEPLGLTQSGLSYHMKILCDSGIVTSRQEGKWTHYRLSSSGRDYAVELLKWEKTNPAIHPKYREGAKIPPQPPPPFVALEAKTLKMCIRDRAMLRT